MILTMMMHSDGDDAVMMMVAIDNVESKTIIIIITVMALCAHAQVVRSRPGTCMCCMCCGR